MKNKDIENEETTKEKRKKPGKQDKISAKEEKKRRQALIKKKKEHIKRVKTIDRQIYILGGIFIFGFIAIAVHVGLYIQNESETAINNSYNTRSKVLEQTIQRGEIYDRNNNILAQTIINEDGTYYRHYPYNELFCHVVGSYDHGKMGLELYENYTMLGYKETLSKALSSDLSGNKIKGNSIVTTLDADLQKLCHDALGDYEGAVVVSNPKTGEILAMVSKPDFDPNTISQNWDTINADTRSVLLNRATKGLYAPGSTFKIVTLTEYIREHKDNYNDYNYVCSGSDTFNNAKIGCFHGEVHGSVDLEKSIAHSCNCSFANMGVNSSASSFRNTVEGFLFNQNLAINDFDISASSFTMADNANEEEKVQCAIGQGTTLLTPLQNLMIISAVANKGTIMKPYVVDKVVSSEGEVVKQTEPVALTTNALTKDEADEVGKLLCSVCEYGTGKELSSLPFKCAGKTGSAEFSGSGESHAWFVGFAPYDDPQIAVSIIVEKQGTGSKYAVPIARKIFESALKEK